MIQKQGLFYCCVCSRLVNFLEFGGNAVPYFFQRNGFQETFGIVCIDAVGVGEVGIIARPYHFGIE